MSIFLRKIMAIAGAPTIEAISNNKEIPSNGPQTLKRQKKILSFIDRIDTAIKSIRKSNSCAAHFHFITTLYDAMPALNCSLEEIKSAYGVAPEINRRGKITIAIEKIIREKQLETLYDLRTEAKELLKSINGGERTTSTKLSRTIDSEIVIKEAMKPKLQK